MTSIAAPWHLLVLASCTTNLIRELHGAAIEVIVSKEVSVGGKFGIDSGLAEEVQSDGCLIKKSVPFTNR